MKREYIEKAKSNYIKELCEANQLTNSVNIDIACNSFLYGADWRIDSVWHEESEKPDTDKGDLLVIIKDAFGKDVYVHQNAYYVLKYGCKKWAYIKDLLPNMEE